jgi:predicted HNH restriction endonuclease
VATNRDVRWHLNFQKTQRRLELKRSAVEHLGSKCQLCGYERCVSAMDFHHTDPSEKDFVISSRMSWEVIVKELRKCVLLCSNCHREVHAGMHPTYLTLEDSLGHEFAGEDYGDDQG